MLNKKDTIRKIEEGNKHEQKGEYQLAYLCYLVALYQNNEVAEGLICNEDWIQERHTLWKRGTNNNDLKCAFEAILDSAVMDKDRGAQWLVAKVLEINYRYFDKNVKIPAGRYIQQYSDHLDFCDSMMNEAKKQGLNVKRIRAVKI